MVLKNRLAILMRKNYALINATLFGIISISGLFIMQINTATVGSIYGLPRVQVDS